MRKRVVLKYVWKPQATVSLSVGHGLYDPAVRNMFLARTVWFDSCVFCVYCRVLVYCIAAIGLGGGPEDPVADAVAAAIGTACGVACETAIKTQHLIPGTPTFEKYMCQKIGF